MDNGIGAEGARALASTLPATLHTLCLEGNEVGCSNEEVLDRARAFRAWTPLHRAADARDATALRRLLADGADPRLCAPVAEHAHADMRSALSLIASASYPLALPVDAALRTEVERAATHVRWSRGTHWQCPRDVREAARSRALLLGGRGMPVMNDDVWGLIFAYLTDGEHERRPLRKKGAATAMVGVCCAGGEAAAPCVACRKAVYVATRRSGGGAAAGAARRPRKRARRM